MEQRGELRRVLETSVRELAGNVRQRMVRENGAATVEKECI